MVPFKGGLGQIGREVLISETIFNYRIEKIVMEVLIVINVQEKNITFPIHINPQVRIIDKS